MEGAEKVNTIKLLDKIVQDYVTVNHKQIIHVENHLSHFILINPSLIDLLMVNIIDNAVKFSEMKPIFVSQSLDHEKGLYILMVQDQGPGFTNKSAMEISELFRQTDESLTRTHEGLGLGLPLIKKLCEEMNGASFFQNLPWGALVRIEIPVDIKEALDDRKVEVHFKDEESTNSSSKKITPTLLIVDDNKINSQVLSKMCQKLGYKTIIATNGNQGVDSYLDHFATLKIILMDIQMPIMNGLDATRMIRQYESKNKRKTIPILAVTAHASEGWSEKCIEAGMQGLLSKPFRVDFLREKINEVLRLNPKN